jgi:hypothetical protein
MKRYHFYARNDKHQEPISKAAMITRYKAAQHFAQIKNLTLKSFLLVYAVSR